MSDTVNVVALSGGKDSTAMALRLRETEPGIEAVYLITPTGDELPEMIAHWNRLAVLLGQSLEVVTRHTLRGLIESYGALPNWRQRWCTRQIKIEPCIAWLVRRQLDDPRPHHLCVGLRADEEERRGMYSDLITPRYPLRQWGWGLVEVKSYLKSKGVKIPTRTDCARCYGQRLVEWWDLWRLYPDIYADAERQEKEIGHTFRSPSRDTWPASLEGLRERFERGDQPRGAKRRLMVLEDDDAEESDRACRVCSM